MRVKYLEYLAATPVLEQITKCGFYNLVSDYMSGKKYSMISLLNEKETSIIKILGLKNRVQLREARSLNINSKELDSIQTYNKTTDVNRSVSDILRLARDYEGREERVFALQTADCENFQNILTVWAAKNMNGIILLLTILTICAAVKSFTMI